MNPDAYLFDCPYSMDWRKTSSYLWACSVPGVSCVAAHRFAILVLFLVDPSIDRTIRFIKILICAHTHTHHYTWFDCKLCQPSCPFTISFTPPLFLLFYHLFTNVSFFSLLSSHSKLFKFIAVQALLRSNRLLTQIRRQADSALICSHSFGRRFFILCSSIHLAGHPLW